MKELIHVFNTCLKYCVFIDLCLFPLSYCDRKLKKGKKKKTVCGIERTFLGFKLSYFNVTSKDSGQVLPEVYCLEGCFSLNI